MASFGQDIHPDFVLGSQVEQKEKFLENVLEYERQERDNCLVFQSKIAEMKRKNDLKVEISTNVSKEKKISEMLKTHEEKEDVNGQRSLKTKKKIRELELTIAHTNKRMKLHRREWKKMIDKKRMKSTDLSKAKDHLSALDKLTETYREKRSKKYLSLMRERDQVRANMRRLAATLQCAPSQDFEVISNHLQSYLAEQNNDDTISGELKVLMERQKKVKKAKMQKIMRLMKSYNISAEDLSDFHPAPSPAPTRTFSPPPFAHLPPPSPPLAPPALPRHRKAARSRRPAPPPKFPCSRCPGPSLGRASSRLRSSLPPSPDKSQSLRRGRRRPNLTPELPSSS